MGDDKADKKKRECTMTSCGGRKAEMVGLGVTSLRMLSDYSLFNHKRARASLRAMRLINTKTLELHEFFDASIPRYAILSHRWEGDEITFQDYGEKRRVDAPGTKKVHKFCEIAANDGLEWGWADTCCIDKKNSVELSEAINSMYRWYKKAVKCYAYLSDVDHLTPEDAQDSAKVELILEQSRWFERGWTLQELIAPETVVFLDQHWSIIGNKFEWAPILSRITRITERVLSYRALRAVCIATKMSWASTRQTSRIEDMAYWLLGIFDVNMPLSYGEGRKAFRRLQHQLIQQSSDMSIFSWSNSEIAHEMLTYSSTFLAKKDWGIKIP